MASEDVVTRARAVVARLSEVEGKATPGPWRRGSYGFEPGDEDPTITSEARDETGGHELFIYDEGGHTVADAAAIVALRNAAPALIRLAEAVARLAADGDEWWYYRAADHDDGTPSCIGCGQLDWRPDALNAGHDSDCPALAIDAALADLAALGGEVAP